HRLNLRGRGAHSPHHAHHHKTTGQTWPHKTKGTPNEHHAMANPAAVQWSCVHRIKHHLPNGMATKPPRWGRGAHSPHHAHHHKTTGQTWPHTTKATPNEHHAMANPAALQWSCVHRIKPPLPNGMATQPPRWGRGAHSPHHAHHHKTRPD